MNNVAAAVTGRLAPPKVDEPVVYEDPGALEALAPAWDQLARSPMQQSIWARAWAEAFGPEYSLRISTAGQPDAPAAIAPLVRRRGGPRRYELLGSELGEPTDVLGRDEAAARALAEELASLRIPLLLHRVPASSPFVSAVSEAYARSLVVLRKAAGRRYIPLDEGWFEPEGRLSPLQRSDLGRARRRAEALGGMTADVLCPGRDEVAGLIDEASPLLASDPQRTAFYSRYAGWAASRGVLRLALLRIGGRIAAAQLAVELADRFWLLESAYDQRFADCTPETLLMQETVRFAAERGLEQFELLGTGDTWAATWTEFEHEVVSVRTYPPARAGLRSLAADGVVLAARSWRGLR